MIVDTKWKRLDLTDDKAGVAQSDVYPMLAYGKAYGRVHLPTRLMLLYPAREGQGTAALRAWNVDGGNFRLQIATLELVSREVGLDRLEELIECR